MDYTANTQILVFTSTVTSLPFIVPIIDDSVTEGTEIFEATLLNLGISNPGFDGVIIQPDRANVTINDNDSKRVCSFFQCGEWTF